MACDLPLFEPDAVVDVHVSSSILATPAGLHEASQHFVYGGRYTGQHHEVLAPEFGVDIAEGAL